MFKQMVFDMVTRSASDSCGPHGHYTHEALHTLANSALLGEAHPQRRQYGTGRSCLTDMQRLTVTGEACNASPVENCHSMMELPGNFEIASQ